MRPVPFTILSQTEAYLNRHGRGGTEWRRAIEDAALKKDEKVVWLSEDDFQALVMRKKKDPVLGWKSPARVESYIARRLAAGESPESIREGTNQRGGGGCGCSRQVESQPAVATGYDMMKANLPPLYPHG